MVQVSGTAAPGPAPPVGLSPVTEPDGEGASPLPPGEAGGEVRLGEGDVLAFGLFDVPGPGAPGAVERVQTGTVGGTAAVVEERPFDTADRPAGVAAG
ncbi:hypothetical protein HLK59_49225, partial [Streptomyces sp. S3(2020)]|nr:hypothetical protein [Streptomyces sp. S3(2020)]